MFSVCMVRKHYWPEFAAAGKERIPVRMLLNHQAGLPAIDLPLAAEALYDCLRLTAAREPREMTENRQQMSVLCRLSSVV